MKLGLPGPLWVVFFGGLNMGHLEWHCIWWVAKMYLGGDWVALTRLTLSGPGGHAIVGLSNLDPNL